MNELRFEHLVFAGNGMSGVACVEELQRCGQVFDITIFGDEPHTNYNRALLPSVLAGERDSDSITLNDIEWYQENGIRTRLGIRVEEIDRLNRAVRSSDGDWTSYDKLILATGSARRFLRSAAWTKPACSFSARWTIPERWWKRLALAFGPWLLAGGWRRKRRGDCGNAVVRF